MPQIFLTIQRFFFRCKISENFFHTENHNIDRRECGRLQLNVYVKERAQTICKNRPDKSQRVNVPYTDAELARVSVLTIELKYMERYLNRTCLILFEARFYLQTRVCGGKIRVVTRALSRFLRGGEEQRYSDAMMPLPIINMWLKKNARWATLRGKFIKSYVG